MNLNTPLATKVVGGVILLVVAALAWFVLLSPTSTQVSEANTAYEDAQANNALIGARLSGLQREADALPETRDAADELGEIFPTTADQPGFFRQVTAAAESAGIGADAITAISPSAPVVLVATAPPAATTTDEASPESGEAEAAPAPVAVPSDLAVQTVTISVDATYTQTRVFLGNLEQMRRALLVTAVSVAAADEGPGLTVTITGDTYVSAAIDEPDLPAPTRQE